LPSAKLPFGRRFEHIDADSDPGSLLGWLDRFSAVPAVREAKSAASDTLELKPGQRVLDVGCGTGVDLPDMLARVQPGGSVTGIDISAQAIAEAARRFADEPAISAEVADVQALPFADASFDACRADRTFQHLAQPQEALAEIRRVLRPGGRLVVLEMKSELDLPEAEREAPWTRRLAELFPSQAEWQGWLPLLLPPLLARTGFVDVGMQVGTHEVRRFEEIDVVAQWSQRLGNAVRDGTVQAEEAEDWLGRLEQYAERGELSFRAGFLRFSARTEDGPSP
jgi:ubiquinone/menaquinone biosynthesis C-methylase UbiE